MSHSDTVVIIVMVDRERTRTEDTVVDIVFMVTFPIQPTPRGYFNPHTRYRTPTLAIYTPGDLAFIFTARYTAIEPYMYSPIFLLLVNRIAAS